MNGQIAAQPPSHAEEAAAAMRAELGEVLRFEEGRLSKRNSGFSGDEDWWGDDGRFAAPAMMGVALSGGGGVSESEEPISFENPTRTIGVNCRARFAIQ